MKLLPSSMVCRDRIAAQTAASGHREFDQTLPPVGVARVWQIPGLVLVIFMYALLEGLSYTVVFVPCL